MRGKGGKGRGKERGRGGWVFSLSSQRQLTTKLCAARTTLSTVQSCTDTTDNTHMCARAENLIHQAAQAPLSRKKSTLSEVSLHALLQSLICCCDPGPQKNIALTNHWLCLCGNQCVDETCKHAARPDRGTAQTDHGHGILLIHADAPDSKPKLDVGA